MLLCWLFLLFSDNCNHYICCFPSLFVVVVVTVLVVCFPITVTVSESNDVNILTVLAVFRLLWLLSLSPGPCCDCFDCADCVNCFSDCSATQKNLRGNNVDLSKSALDKHVSQKCLPFYPVTTVFSIIRSQIRLPHKGASRSANQMNAYKCANQSGPWWQMP